MTVLTTFSTLLDLFIKSTNSINIGEPFIHLAAKNNYTSNHQSTRPLPCNGAQD
jgi:hypothetical protein